MQPHEQRVLVEKEQLDERLRNLTRFIDKAPAFNELAPEDKTLLRQQQDLMERYSEVLGERIARFPV